MKHWLDCVVSRKTPNADIELSHQSVSLGHLANITRALNRKLRWNPEREEFAGDRDANQLVNRPCRRPYKLPKL